jgi:hypothetical protein
VQKRALSTCVVVDKPSDEHCTRVCTSLHVAVFGEHTKHCFAALLQRPAERQVLTVSHLVRSELHFCSVAPEQL